MKRIDKAIVCRIQGLSKDDALLLRWALLGAPVLLATMCMMLGGAFEGTDTAQLALLCGRPFYLEAEATQYPALSPAGMFGLCTAVSLYLALVLLRQRSFSHRAQVVLPALVAALLPGVLCVLWDCVFYIAAPVFCILLTWLLVECIPFYRRARA